MNNKKKILFIVPSLSRAGAETQVVDMVNGLDPAKFEKHLFTFEKNLEQLDRLDREHISFYNRIRRHKYDLSVVKAIAKIIDSKKIDVVHCSLQIALMMGWLGIKISQRKPRLVLAIHTTINRNKRNELFDRYLYQWLMRGCHQVICVCKAQEAHWQQKFPFLRGKTQIVYNGIDTEYFNPQLFIEKGMSLRKLLNIPPSASVVCNIAAFRPEKGHSILIDAFERVLQQNKNTYLILAGDGELRPRIMEMTREKGIEGNVRFLGSVADVRPMLAASNLATIASAVETFSIAMLESMAMEVPLVATNVGGTSEAILHQKTGLIVPPNSSGRLAEAIVLMLKDDKKRLAMGLVARNLVKDRFTKQTMILKTDSLLSES